MDAPAIELHPTPMPALLGPGSVTCFFDELGIGSFATQTTAMVLDRMVRGDEIPGTLSVGNAIQALAEAPIYGGLEAVNTSDPTIQIAHYIAACILSIGHAVTCG